jgi:hypothetical protein
MGLSNHCRLLMGLNCDRKVTPRIIGLSRPIVQIDGEACYTAVGSSYPGRAQAAKGAGVHILKGIVSWVKIVVRQIV